MAKRQQTFQRAARKRKAKQRARRAEDNRRTAAQPAGRPADKDVSKPQPDQG